MASGKANLAFIDDDIKRKRAYKERTKTLLKMTEELSTLCGIETCAIVYGPSDPQPEVWPSESGVQNVVGKFRNMPEWRQSHNMVNQETLIERSIQKGREKMQNLVKMNKEMEMSMFMFRSLSNSRMVRPDYNSLTTVDLNVLSSVIDHNLKDITQRMENLSVNQVTPYQPQMRTQTNQPDMQTPAYQPQMQNSTYQPQMQTPTLEEMSTLLKYGDGSAMNANPMQSQSSMG